MIHLHIFLLSQFADRDLTNNPLHFGGIKMVILEHQEIPSPIFLHVSMGKKIIDSAYTCMSAGFVLFFFFFILGDGLNCIVLNYVCIHITVAYFYYTCLNVC